MTIAVSHSQVIAIENLALYMEAKKIFLCLCFLERSQSEASYIIQQGWSWEHHYFLDKKQGKDKKWRGAVKGIANWSHFISCAGDDCSMLYSSTWLSI